MFLMAQYFYYVLLSDRPINQNISEIAFYKCLKIHRTNRLIIHFRFTFGKTEKKILLIFLMFQYLISSSD